MMMVKGYMRYAHLYKDVGRNFLRILLLSYRSFNALTYMKGFSLWINSKGKIIDSGHSHFSWSKFFYLLTKKFAICCSSNSLRNQTKQRISLIMTSIHSRKCVHVIHPNIREYSYDHSVVISRSVLRINK